MSKYNVGDVVKLRDDLEIDRQYGGITFTNYKNEFKNESIKIIQVSEGDNTYRVIDEDNNAIWISEEMIEGLWEECKEKQDKLKLIDVLNMIAKKELEEGTKVIYKDMEFVYDGEDLWSEEDLAIYFFIDGDEELNDEVKLIEPDHFTDDGKMAEPSKIEELDEKEFAECDTNGKCYRLFYKLNEVIGKINKEQ